MVVAGERGDRSGIGRAARAFADWYAREARGILPRWLAGWLTDSGGARLVIGTRAMPETGAQTATLTSYRGQRRLSQQHFDINTRGANDQSGPALASVIASVRASKGEIALEIAAGRCLTRVFDIPREAVRNLEAVLAADIARRTPFAPADVVHGYVAAPVDGQPAKLTVTHMILRRDLASADAERLGLTLEHIDALIPVGPTGMRVGPSIRLTPPLTRPRWPGRLALALMIAGIALLATGLVDTLGRLEAERAHIEGEISVAAAKAKTVREQIEGASGESALLAALTAEKAAQPGLMEVWEELSRLLPDGTWITEARLTEDKPGERMVTIAGYSDGATALVGLLARSPVLAEPALTAAITPDATEGKDRFALQARIVTGGAKSRVAP